MAQRRSGGATGRKLVRMSALLAGLAPFVAQAQPFPDHEQTASVLDIDRPGYNPRTLRVKSITIKPELDFGTVYDSNVYAAPQDRRDDAVFTLRPAISAEDSEGHLRWRADAHALARRYASNTRENSETYGVSLKSAVDVNSAITLGAIAGYRRAVENRSDPEVRQNPTLGPPLFDALNGELNGAVTLGKLAISAKAQVEKYNFVSAANDDRDFTSYRGTLRLLYQLGSAISAFGQGYVNQRRFRIRDPLTGLDRDSRTMGGLAGVQINPGGKVRGDIGAGVFRYNPEDPVLRSFTGFALEGSLVYVPRRRTAIILDVFSGDVATVRNGASGRIDRRARMTIQQEVRHNLLATLGVRYRQTRYRGVDARLTTVGADGELEFLFNRHLSMAAIAQVSKRTARDPSDRFERVRVGAEIRYRF